MIDNKRLDEKCNNLNYKVKVFGLFGLFGVLHGLKDELNYYIEWYCADD